MNVIVLGNGFDLAHGLPTRYTDFLKYCRDYDSGCIPISSDQTIMNEFKESIKNNIWLIYFLSITPNLNEDKTWIDFETEILKAIRGMCPGQWLGARNQLTMSTAWETLTREEFENSQYGIFHDFLLFPKETMEDMATIDYEPVPPIIDVNGLYMQLRKFTRAFEIYCCCIINNKCGIRKRYKLNESLLLPNRSDAVQKNYIVSFNYTRTFNKYYDYCEHKSPIQYSYVYPHGEACTDVTLESALDGLITSGLVLGTRSFERAVDDQEYEISLDFNAFQKHNQQHRYSTLADFQNLLLELRKGSESKKSEPVNIYIMGHSLDISDHAKLKHLFTEDKNANITIFYHDEASFQRYINRITDILGESDVAVRVRFYHQNNMSNGLLLPYWSFSDGRVNDSVIDAAEDRVKDILTDYFISNKVPSSLDELSTHTSIESVEVKSIDIMELKDERSIMLKGSGYIEVELQYGSNSDLKQGNGDVSNVTFPIEFTLWLAVEDFAEKSEDEKYELSDIDYEIDTSGDYSK